MLQSLSSVAATSLRTRLALAVPATAMRRFKHDAASASANGLPASAIALPSVSSTTATSASGDLASGTGASVASEHDHAADLSLLIHRLRSAETARRHALTGELPAHQQYAAARRMDAPLMPAHHPLLTDDFSVQTPFVAPPRPSTALDAGKNKNTSSLAMYAPLSTQMAVAEAADAEAEDAIPEQHERAAVALMGHPLLPYLLQPGLPLLPMEVPVAAGAPAAPGASAIDESESQLAFQMMTPRGQLPVGVFPPTAQDEVLMTSVLRKRRKKMNKHKLRKLRKSTRSQRK
ncbi:hypothetical protein BC828DRAFT_375077 [Blastocladiella britannica]|nr:hypothetical protein BC828DRAFT_375077 [Blastocladiella britannica]